MTPRARAGVVVAAFMVTALVSVALLSSQPADGTTTSRRAADVAPPSTKPVVSKLPAPQPDDAAPLLPADAQVPREPAPSAPALPRRDGPGDLLVRVLWEADGSPAAGIALELAASESAATLHPLAGGSTDEAGEWHVRGLPPGPVTVRSDRGLSARGRVGAGQLSVLSIELPPGVPLRGEVVDAGDRPVPGAAIWLTDYSSETFGAVVARTDAFGLFEVRGLTSHLYLSARAPGHTSSPLFSSDDAAVGRGLVTLQLGPPGGSVRGRVLAGDGRPVAGAIVLVTQSRREPAGRRARLPDLRASSGPDGAFAVEDVPAGAARVHVEASGWSPESAEAQVVAGGATTVDILLPRLAIVAGSVTDTHGRPLPGVLVSAPSPRPGVRLTATTDAEGLFQLVGLAPGRVRVSASLSGVDTVETTLDVARGGRCAWSPVLDAGLLLTGRVVDATGEPARDLNVRVSSSDESVRWQRHASLGAGGHFTIANCEAVPCRLDVYDGDAPSRTTPLATLEGVTAGGPELTVALPMRRGPSACVEGAVVYASGQPASDVLLVLAASGTTGGVQVEPDPRTGRFLAGPVEPGPATLSIRAGGRQVHALYQLPLEEGRTLDAGTIELVEPGRLVVRPELAAGLPADAVSWSLVTPAETWAGPLEPARDGSLCATLEPGDYELRVSGRWVLPQALAVTIEAATTTELTVPLARGVECAVGVALPPGGEAGGDVSCEVYAADGTVVQASALDLRRWNRDDQRRASGVLNVPPGTYRLRVLVDGEERLDEPFDVPDHGPTTARFEWSVRGH